MIAFLKGTVKDINENTVILDVNGVGYEIHSSSKTLKDVPVSEIIEMWIYTHVREDSLKLFGFSSLLEKKLFLAFIGINGVGPKMALALLSAAPSLRELMEMIEEEDINGLIRLPRVGKKSAQQIILALKGQLKEGWLQQSERQLKARQSLTTTLLNLGFRSSEIRSALEQMKRGPNSSMEEELKTALSYLQPGR